MVVKRFVNVNTMLALIAKNCITHVLTYLGGYGALEGGYIALDATD